MCDFCIINSIKEKMLSRRGMLKTAALATGASITPGSATMAKGHNRMIDMTHTLSEDFPTYSGTPDFSRKPLASFAKDGFNMFELTMGEHVGTHIDAPLHFSADGLSVDELAVENLAAPLCVVDITSKAANNPDAQLTPDDLKSWTAKHGDIPAHACVAMFSGWGDKVGTAVFRNFDGSTQHYPGFHVEAVAMLIENTQATSIAVDTLSIDYGKSADFATHYRWLPSGRFGIESLANLDKVPAVGATLIVGAPKHRGGTGGPARIFTLI